MISKYFLYKYHFLINIFWNKRKKFVKQKDLNSENILFLKNLLKTDKPMN